MKKYTVIAILSISTLFSCGTKSESGNDGGAEANVEKVELTYSMSGESEVKLENAKGTVREEYGNMVLSFEGDNGGIDIYISSEKLKVQEYKMDLEDLSAKNVLASYTIKVDGESAYCCGKSGSDISSGSITITSIEGAVVSGKIDAKSYDGSSIVGTFGAVVEG